MMKSKQMMVGLGLAALAIGTPLAAQPGASPGGPDGAATEAQMQELMKKFLREKNPPPEVPLPPPLADRRNLEGTWNGNQLTALRLTQDLDGKPIPLNNRGKAILDRRVKSNYADHEPYANAGGYCLPPGTPWQFGLLYPFQIYQSPRAVLFIFSEYHTAWNIRLDASPRPGVRAYMGESVGRWEGDTLVVDTTGFKQPLWVDADGSPASADARLTLRIRRIGKDGDQMEIVTTVDDPVNYTRPFSFARTFGWRPDMEFFYEYDCENQLGPDPAKNANLKPEPAE